MPFSPAAHVDRVLSTVHARALVPDASQGLIHRSWQRCMSQHGLDPNGPFSLRVESGVHVRSSREQLGEGLEAARGGMAQLFKHVVDLGYVVLLTDAEGVTVDYLGNDSWDRDARRAGLDLGTNWQESVAGTNGIGTCIHEQRALTCHQNDHFYAGNIGLSCSTAPLFHPDGRIMGALDVSTLATPNTRDSQHLARHLTALYARMIDDANFVRHFRDHCILRVDANWALVDVRGDMMLAIDPDGLIVGASTIARQWLRDGGWVQQGDDGIAGRSLAEIFDCSTDQFWRMAHASDSTQRGLLSRLDQKHYFISVIAPMRRTATADASRRTGATDEVGIGPALRRLAGTDPRMWALQQQAQRLADKPIHLLIQGETGSGKEVLAKAIHAVSSRRDRPFVAVNCAAIPESLIESELFGYSAGTFTGARSRGMKGLIVQADHGTLFLDEIGDMPVHLQTRLLRVLSEEEVLPLGAQHPVSVSLTVIAASHRDLQQLVHAGSFREDLYYRLCGATLRLPALRERKDLGYLIDLILLEEATRMERRGCLSTHARALLLQHPWPGNVRQLRNIVRLGLALSDGRDIEPQHLFPDSTGCDAPGPAQRSDARHEPSDRLTAQSLLAALQAQRWNISAVAARTGHARTTIYRQMKRFGIVSPQEAANATARTDPFRSGNRY